MTKPIARVPTARIFCPLCRYHASGRRVETVIAAFREHVDSTHRESGDMVAVRAPKTAEATR